MKPDTTIDSTSETQKELFSDSEMNSKAPDVPTPRHRTTAHIPNHRIERREQLELPFPNRQIPAILK